MNQHLETRQLNYLNDSILNESSEGGLNLQEVKNTIFRNIPLIAGITLCLTSLSLLKIVITPPKYIASFELLSESLNIETKVTSRDDSSRKTREQITSVELDEVQLKILKSPRLLNRIVESIQEKYPEFRYSELIEGLTIGIIPGSAPDQNILQVVYENPDREKVSEVIRVLTKIYLDYSVEKRQQGVKRGVAFLDQQIPRVSSEVQAIKDQIRFLRNQHNFTDPDTSLNRITNRLDLLEQAEEENADQLQELRSASERLEAEIKSQPVKLTTATELATELAIPEFHELLKQMQGLDVEIGRKSAVFSDKSEILRALKQERQQLKSLIIDDEAKIRQKLDTRIATLERQQEILRAKIDDQKLRLEQWSRISAEFNGLQQELNFTNNKLNEFRSQQDFLQIDAAQQESPWQLLNPASDPTTNSISALNYLVLSSSLGLILGSGVALVLDKHQKIIYTSAKVEEITHLPILTTIPFSPQAKQLSLFGNINLPRQERELSSQNQSSSNLEALPVKYSNSSIEVFRSFAVNLGLLNFNQDPSTIFKTNLKSVVITSAIPREGKSTVALNLARALASMGKRVLLVDADLRSTERLTTDLGFEAQIGLKDILIPSSRYRVMNCIQQLLPEENLFLLASGIGIGASNFGGKDDSCLLASEQMHHLMAELETHFDLIIYDLCSINGFADVNLIAAQTDGIVVVTGLGKIQSVALTEALNQLRLCNAPVLGIAVNKVVKKS